VNRHDRQSVAGRDFEDENGAAEPVLNGAGEPVSAAQ
jgi:hypothetical protein